MFTASKSNPPEKSQDVEAKARNEEIQSRQFRRAEDIARAIDGVTMGYIGNVYSDGRDDRSWSIFLPHPGRVGTSEDRIGSFPTAQRGRLLPLVLALSIGIKIGRAQSEAKV